MAFMAGLKNLYRPRPARPLPEEAQQAPACPPELPGTGEAAAEAPPDPWTPRQPHPDQHFGCFTYAQHGDDLVIAGIFRALGQPCPSYLDIGAHHPLHISNTALLYARGSRGINVEANPNLIEAFRIHRPQDLTLNVGIAARPSAQPLTFYMIDKWSGRNTFSKDTAEQFIGAYPDFSITETIEVPVMTVAEIVERHCGGVFPDFLSIDVEGLDEAILRSIDYRHSAPQVICAETVSADNLTHNTALKDFLASQGYFSLIRCGGNTIFVQERHRERVC